MRLYVPEECTGKGGYPPEWHATIKHSVREAADDRCVRCLHPYAKGDGRWSRCDELCRHETTMDAGVQYIVNEWTEPIPGGGTALLNDNHYEAEWRILTVHHLDGDKGNCRWWNLAALCQRCHLTIQGRVQMERIYPWPHSEWFKPYAAGYYAWTYLGEEITRAEALERMDELLALELAA